MSGPKGYSYTVSSQELQRTQAISSARSQCAALWQQLSADVAQVRAIGGTVTGLERPPSIADSASATQARAIAAEFERRAQTVRAQCRRARSAAVARSFAAHLPPSVAATIDIVWRSDASGSRPASRRSAHDETAGQQAADQRATSTEVRMVSGRLLAGLAEVLDEARRTAWVRTVTELTGSPRMTTATLRRLRDVEQEVGEFLVEQARKLQLRAEADQIALSIADLETPAARRALAELNDVDDRSQLRHAADLARVAREQYLAEMEREFVVEQTAQALRELGYRVDQGFRTAALDGQFVVATTDELPGHGLQLKFPASGRRVLTNAVAVVEDTTSEQDVQAEEVTCAHLDLMQSRVARTGVSLIRVHTKPPGAVPIERRTDAARPRSAAHKDGRDRPAQQRRRER